MHQNKRGNYSVRWDLGLGPKILKVLMKQRKQSQSFVDTWQKLYPLPVFFIRHHQFSLSLSHNGLQWSGLAFEFSRERACRLVFFLSSSANLIPSLFTSEPLTPCVSVSVSLSLSHPHSFWISLSSFTQFNSKLVYPFSCGPVNVYLRYHLLCSQPSITLLTIWECLWCIRWIFLSISVRINLKNVVLIIQNYRWRLESCVSVNCWMLRSYEIGN